MNIKKEMIIKNAKIVTPKKIIFGTLKIENGIITKIYNHSNFSKFDIDAKKNLVIPGFIDLQINGGYGIDFNNTNKNEIKIFLKEIIKTGTTKILATILTSSIPKIIKNLMLLNHFAVDKNNIIFGVHLEGPFISKEKKGAHNEKYICKPNLKLIKQILNASKKTLKIITMAVENSDEKITKFLTKNNVIVSAGHSIANYEQIKNHEESGLRLCTHLFNAMLPLHTKKPLSISNRIIDSKKITACLIPDNYHVDKKIIKLIYQIKGCNNLILVSDAIPLLGLKNAKGNLDTIKIESKKGVGYILNTNILAGSMISMFDCFKNILKYTQCSVIEATKMTSLNQAKVLGIEKEYGSIEIGKVADIVILKSKNEIKNVIKNGKIILE